MAELLRFLKTQIVFVQGPTHKFVSDNPNVTLVYTPSTFETSIPAGCNYLLLPTTSKPQAIPDFDLVAKVVNPNNVLSFYAKSSLNFDFDFTDDLLNSLSQYARMLSGVVLEKYNPYVSVVLSNNASQPLLQQVARPTRLSEAQVNQPIFDWDECASKAAYSVYYYPPAAMKEKGKCAILVDSISNSYSFPHSITLYKQNKVYHSKSSFFSLLEQYKNIKHIPIYIISLPLRPKRRMNLKKQLDQQQLSYVVSYGLDGKAVNLAVPADQSQHSKPVLQVTTPEESYIYDPSIRPNGRMLSWGEIGCAVSHLRLYREFSSEFMFVFEDDAKIDNFQRFFEQIRNLPSSESFDLCWMQNEATWWPPVYDTPINEWFCRTIGSVNLTHAYILTKRGKNNLSKWESSIKSKVTTSPLNFLMLPSDDYLSHAVRANVLTCIAPYLRCVSTQHAESDIGSMGAVSQREVNIYPEVSVKNFGDMWTGLGNQMWQYAVAKLYSLKVRGRLVLPSQNKCSLAFVLCSNLSIKDAKQNLATSLLKEEKEFEIIPELLNPKNKGESVLLEGYFQNKAYLEQDSYLVREMFTFLPPIQQAATQIINQIRQKNRPLVAVHIRRRDFRGETSPFLYYLYTQETLKTAMSKVNVADPIYCYFSNDKEDVVANFNLPEGVWIDVSKQMLGPHKSGLLELCVMSMCDHFVLSASTYSWWGAFLCKNEEKQVVYPPHWFNPERADCKDKVVEMEI